MKVCRVGPLARSGRANAAHPLYWAPAGAPHGERGPGVSLAAMGDIASFESPVLSIEVEDTVATVWLDRPEARNAMGVDLWRDLPRAMDAVSADSSVRVVVVAAKGPHFSVGLDLKAMGDMLTGGGSEPEPGGERSAGLPGRQGPAGPAQHPAPPGRHHGGGRLPQAGDRRRARLLHRRRGGPHRGLRHPPRLGRRRLLRARGEDGDRGRPRQPAAAALHHQRRAT